MGYSAAWRRGESARARRILHRGVRESLAGTFQHSLGLSTSSKLEAIVSAQTRFDSDGMTVDQVEAAPGQPDKKVTIGARIICVYKDLKVTFTNGKVTDAQ